MVQPADREFYAGLPLFEAFEGVADEANYRPLPDGWWLAVADIVNSTGAIAEGRYKSVNMIRTRRTHCSTRLDWPSAAATGSVFFPTAERRRSWWRRPAKARSIPMCFSS